MTDFLWDSAVSGVVSGFIVNPFDLMTTELNGAGSGTTQVSSVGGAGGIFTSETNFGQAIWGQIWFEPGAAMSPASGGFLSGWFLTSPDGGSTFEASPPQRNPDFIVPLPASVASGSLYAADGLVRLPAPDAKVALENNTTVSLPASGSHLKVGPVAVKY
jgi:hypothetical protein